MSASWRVCSNPRVIEYVRIPLLTPRLAPGLIQRFQIRHDDFGPAEGGDRYARSLASRAHLSPSFCWHCKRRRGRRESKLLYACFLPAQWGNFRTPISWRIYAADSCSMYLPASTSKLEIPCRLQHDLIFKSASRAVSVLQVL